MPLMRETTRTSAIAPRRELIILSDLHMGRGKNTETGRFFALEAFFYDDDFLRFCRYLCADATKRGASLRVIINGDVFDLLRIEPEQGDPALPLIDRRYGAIHTPELAARMAHQILLGHPNFVRGIAELLRSGHEVIMLAGNHDIEIQWESVRDEIRHALENVLAEEGGPKSVRWALLGLRFEDWFYYEPGRIWVEHGCQYDPENAFRYPLRHDVPTDPEAVRETEHDMPLGNFFQRYLYNGFGHVTFIVPTSRANPRYLRYLLVNQPRLLFGVLASHLPFVFQVLRRLAKAAMHSHQNLKRVHEGVLARLAVGSGLGERLYTVDKMKETNADAFHATRSLTKQFVFALGLITLISLSGLGLWFVGLMAISELRGAGFGLRAFLFLILNFLMAGAAVATLTYSLLRAPSVEHGKAALRAAQKLVDLMDVPIVTFGHTHEETLSRLSRPNGGRAWFYNTGTWIAVFTHDVLMPRERVQYTYLRVRHDEGELVHWSPGRGEPLPVILLDETGSDGFGLAPVAAPPPPAKPAPVVAKPAEAPALAATTAATVPSANVTGATDASDAHDMNGAPMTISAKQA